MCTELTISTQFSLYELSLIMIEHIQIIIVTVVIVTVIRHIYRLWVNYRLGGVHQNEVAQTFGVHQSTKQRWRIKVPRNRRCKR